MADFSNNRRFSLRSLSEDLIPVNIRLRSNIKTPKDQHIIRKAEKALLNERIRSINNTITMLKVQVDTYKNHLENILDKESMEECIGFIKDKRKSRHLKTLECQKLKFERLCHKSKKIEGGHSNTHHGNHDQIKTNNTSHSKFNTNCTRENESEEGNNNTWVRNISSIPLTEAQLKVLSHGPNFAVVPKYPPVDEYIASMEQECSQLKQWEVEELRGEVKAILKKIQPQSLISPGKSKRHWLS